MGEAMGTVTVETRIEPETTMEKTYTLIFPEEKGRRRSHLREWLLLQLIHVGYETLDMESFCFGRFPQTVKIKAFIEETEEMRAILKMCLEANNVKLGDPSLGAVK